MYNIPVFVDVGAHWGLYSLYFSSSPLLRALEIIAFEPDPRNFGQLQANIFLNQRNLRVRAECLALSSKAGSLQFTSYPDENRGRSCVASNPGYNVICGTLDTYLLGHKAPSVAIKIDVEGHELSVLHGAFNTLSDRACVVQVEVKSQARPDVHQFFDQLGYRLARQLGEDYVHISPHL